MQTIPDEQVQPGTIIDYMGSPHMVAEIVPHTHPTIPEVFGIARAANGWDITLIHGERTRVVAP